MQNRTPKPHRVTIWLTPADHALLLLRKGSAKPGGCASHLLSDTLNNRAPTRNVPEINLAAWRVLSRLAGTLEALAKQSVIARIDADETKKALTQFREAMIGATQE